MITINLPKETVAFTVTNREVALQKPIQREPPTAILTTCEISEMAEKIESASQSMGAKTEARKRPRRHRELLSPARRLQVC
jgi:hypothetical protein